MAGGKDKAVAPMNEESEEWSRFERAVDAAVKSGPKHRQAPRDARKEGPPSKGRVQKGKAKA
jgi:hypothetical protein